MDQYIRSQKGLQIQCPLCSIEFDPSISKTNICQTCLVGQEDITKDISTSEIIEFCTYCRRYNRPPYILCERESSELLSLCLKKVKGLNKVKLLHAAFIWTEAHSRVIKIKCTIQKELLNFAKLESDVVIEFKEHYKQCKDCRKEFTPHTWGASIQLRQRVEHKKTFYFLEQLIIKNHMEDKILRIENVDEGLDIFFQTLQQAKALIEFINQALPVRVKHSTELISQDLKSNTSHTKHTFSIEIPIICKDNLVLLPSRLCKQLGGIGRIQICYKISTIIHLIDPLSMKCTELFADDYFQYEVDIKVLELKRDGSEFTVVDVDFVKNTNLNESYLSSITNNFIDRVVNISVMNETDYEVQTVKSHLGGIVKVGQTVLGYDLTKIVHQIDEISKRPDIVIVTVKREKPPKKLKLKRMRIENNQEKKGKSKQKQEDKNEDDFEEFLIEAQNDQELKKLLVTEEEGQQEQQQLPNQQQL